MVTFNDNSQQEADVIFYGIGDIPNTDFLDPKLLNKKNKGVLVNEYLQSLFDENIYSAGDISSFPV